MAIADSAAAPMRQAERDDDIVVNIHRHFHCQFQGTSEQLRAEKLLPPDLALPVGRRSLQWADEKWRFKLVRTRAPGSTALFVEWKHQDWWRLYRWSQVAEMLSFSDARTLECHEELKRIQWSHSPAGRRQANLSWHARQDRELQAFIKVLGGGKR